MTVFFPFDIVMLENMEVDVIGVWFISLQLSFELDILFTHPVGAQAKQFGELYVMSWSGWPLTDELVVCLIQEERNPRFHILHVSLESGLHFWQLLSKLDRIFLEELFDQV